MKTPSRQARAHAAGPMRSHSGLREVVIVGGGPTGLLTALLLARRNVSSLVLEQTSEIAPESRAIGITPRSLEILEEVELAERLLTRGVMVRRAVVHNSDRVLGALEFDGVHPSFPAIVSCPQATTWSILHDAAAADPRIELRHGTRVATAVRTGGRFQVKCDTHDGRVDAGDAAREGGGDGVHARVVVVADGAGGKVAPALGFSRRAGRYRPEFFMADMVDRSALGQEAHLWFTRSGAVESFPLPDGRRRWVVQTGDGPGREREARVDLEAMVAQRTGISLDASDRRWESGFQPSWSRLTRFALDRVFVVGDAAHTMSPIGGQGMNSGFADAELAAGIIAENLGRGDGANRGDEAVWIEAARRYHFSRVRAAKTSTRRAWAGMSVGTLRGGARDAVRSALIGWILASPLRGSLARHFAMLTLPRGASSST